LNFFLLISTLVDIKKAEGKNANPLREKVLRVIKQTIYCRFYERKLRQLHIRLVGWGENRLSIAEQEKTNINIGTFPRDILLPKLVLHGVTLISLNQPEYSTKVQVNFH
jgi:hypothetical protein